MKYFRNSYDESHYDFLERVELLKKLYPSIEADSHMMPPDNIDGMYTDSLFVPGKKDNKLLIITSGVHGIEGYTGSAIQNMIIDNFLLKNNLKTGKKEFIQPKYPILFIHIINPYGHKYFRRVNENNVDLNRNFLPGVFDFRVEVQNRNKAYAEMADFLIPKGPYRYRIGEKILFLLKTLVKVKQKGIKLFRQAILQGQYQFKEGIFFGGHLYQPQFLLIDQLLEKYAIDRDEVVAIDIHTGYGERGKLHLIGLDRYPEPGILEYLQKLYPHQTIEQASADDGDFYKIEGALFEHIFSKLRKKDVKVYPIAWEFGTNNNTKTLKSLESLRIIIGENQSYHYNTNNARSYRKITKDFRELFYPSDRKWRTKVMQTALDTFEQLLKNFD